MLKILGIIGIAMMLYTLIYILQINTYNQEVHNTAIKSDIAMKNLDYIRDAIHNNDYINEERNKINKNKKICNIILFFCIILPCVFLVMTALGYIIIGVAVFILWVLTLIIYIFFQIKQDRWKKSVYSNAYANVVTDILKKHYDIISYNHDVGIDERIYINADFVGDYDIYLSKDLTNMSINNYNVEIANVLTKKMDDTSDTPHYHYVFDGMFASINLNKQFSNEIEIIRKNKKIFKKSNKDKYFQVDNELFQKNFDVFCDDKNMITNLLNSNFVSDLMDLFNKSSIKFDVKIKENFLYICFFTPDMFNVKLNDVESESKQITTYISIFDSIVKIITCFIEEIDKL